MNIVEIVWFKTSFIDFSMIVFSELIIAFIFIFCHILLLILIWLLKDGLRDRSEIVRDCVSKVLLPTWLRYYKGEYTSFIHALDIGVGTESATSALRILFK